MQTSKRALTGLWIILALAFCIGVGVLTGLHGGMHNEAGAIYDSSGGRHAIVGRDAVRLGILGVTALATLARSLGGIFPPRRKHNRSSEPSKV